ncbi:MAG: hypothetical protein ABEI54_04170, partial [Candidatus Bipolaricaulia bacterium]
PPFSQLTSEVYSRFDELNGDFEKGLSEDDRDYPLELGNFTVENDLQRAAIDLNPELETYLDLLENASTIQTAGVAGSGSSLFGISRLDVSSEEIREELEEDLWSISEEAKLFVTRPTNHGQIVSEEEQ